MVNQNKTKLVVIVDDDDSMRSAVQDLLEAVGLASTEALRRRRNS